MSTDEADLAGLDLEAAREYILAYSIDLKRTEKDIDAARAELERWRARVALVEGRLAAATGDASLLQLLEAARAKAEEQEARIVALDGDRADLRGKIARMRDQLPMIKARERSIDPDRLLAELQLMTGELLGSEGSRVAAPEAEFAKLEAEAKASAGLEDLKRRAAEDAGAGSRAGGAEGGSR